MNSDDPQGPRTRLPELVRYVGWPDQDVSSRDFYRALPHCKGGLSLQDEKDLIIGVAVEPGAFIRRELHPEKRNGDAFIVLPLKQIAMLKLLFGYDRCHLFSLFLSFFLHYLVRWCRCTNRPRGQSGRCENPWEAMTCSISLSSSRGDARMLAPIAPDTSLDFIGAIAHPQSRWRAWKTGVFTREQITEPRPQE